VLTAPFYLMAVEAAYQPQRWRQEWREVEVLRSPQYVPPRSPARSRLLQEISFAASGLYWWSTYLLRQPWDAVVAVCPPLTSGLVPALMYRRRTLPLVIHVQDLQLDAARELGILRQPLLLAGLTRLERHSVPPGPGGDHHFPRHGGPPNGQRGAGLALACAA
jgi:colanic acid biosynthesis glycosyl transferase WcaI